ncbi:MAG: RdgB/HAM1 family non-canonical purine NTP pyrophosphatase [Saprospiraceae bacterium]|nr:RdgB/HAM1 family non-canonical purine NTP pyrophosphatase [Saprospiraceae bacterium]
MSLVMASANPKKIEEVRQILPERIQIISLEEMEIYDDIPETGNTLEENALIKARFIHQSKKCNCFAEDSGLEVYSLRMEPGVYSARYAGLQKSSEDNINLLLKNLENEENRNARFRTVLALILDEKEYLFEGIIQGSISKSRSGLNGFGYDPVFVPDGSVETFAQLNPEQKNEISHRGIAVRKFIDFLKLYTG